MNIMSLGPKGELLWVDSNNIHNFQCKVIHGTEFMPNDADLNIGKRIVSGIRKPYLLHIFLLRTSNKCLSEISYNTAQICANLREHQRKTHPLEGLFVQWEAVFFRSGTQPRGYGSEHTQTSLCVCWWGERVGGHTVLHYGICYHIFSYVTHEKKKKI